MQCPTCDWPLESGIVGGQPFERCGRCGGEFFGHRALEALLSAHAPAPDEFAGGYRRPSPLSDPVVYRKCPQCREPMLRRNFRETSGVVIDACAHGIWLDRGELASLIEFAATGGLAAADHRLAERVDARRRLDTWGKDLRSLGARHYLGSIPVDAVALDSVGPLRGLDDHPPPFLPQPATESEPRTPRDELRRVVPSPAVAGGDVHPYRGGKVSAPPPSRSRRRIIRWALAGVVLLLGALLWRALVVGHEGSRDSPKTGMARSPTT